MSRDPHYAVPGGESPAAFFARCCVALEELAARHAGETIAVVTHGLVLEITENIFLSDYERLSTLLHDIKQHGVTFSIDDFGTGHSSLRRLRQLPVGELKIDRSFVMDMQRSKDDEAIVRSTIDLAHNLGLRVCAEGVESAEIMQQLYRWRCDMIQGYRISKALPVAELEAFIRASRWDVNTLDRDTRSPGNPAPRRE